MIYLLLFVISAEYQVEFYSYQKGWKINPPPATTHTFARFSKIENRRKTNVDISWEPVDGKVFGGFKKGRYTSVEEAIYFARKKRYNIRKWGPYITTEQVFQSALCQRTTQNRTRYNLFKNNCIQAVLSTSGSQIDTGLSRGFNATRQVVRHFHNKGLLK